MCNLDHFKIANTVFFDKVIQITGELFCRKDVRLPVHLQRAMAAEAEAAREARAKVKLERNYVPVRR